MTDQIAFITGANRGLGRSMAQHLATAGVGVIGTYFSNQEEADAVVRELTAAGGKVVMLQLDIEDVTTFSELKTRLLKTLQDKFDRSDLDFVIQNAGNGILGTFEQLNGDDLDSLYRVHFKGPYLLNQALIPVIAKGGRIINVSTAATRFYLDNHGAYSAMKAAVEVITFYMAKELGDRQITVNAIAPGAIETDFAGGAVRDNAEINKIYANATPLGRVGRPDDIGMAIVSLLSKQLGWLNGQRIELTGGQSL